MPAPATPDPNGCPMCGRLDCPRYESVVDAIAKPVAAVLLKGSAS